MCYKKSDAYKELPLYKNLSLNYIKYNIILFVMLAVAKIFFSKYVPV